MSNGHFSENVLLGEDSQVLGASVTAQSVTKDFHITAGGALNIRLDVVADTVTAGAGISFKLQTSSGVNKDGARDWVDSSGTVAITAAGSYSLALNIQDVTNDETYLPLRPLGRVVITTGAGSAVTIERVSLMQAK